MKRLALPIEYYVGDKFMSLFSDDTLPSEHVYLVWDLIIFYSAIQEEVSTYGNIMPLAVSLFFFQNAANALEKQDL